MTSSSNIIAIPGTEVAFFVPGTNRISQPWYRWLVSLISQANSGDMTLTGDVTGTASASRVVSTHLTTPLPLAQGGLGATTAAGGRTTLGLGTIATQNANALNATLGASLLSSSTAFNIGASGAGIAGIFFGSNAVSLNDYEEGSFTPTIIGSGTAGVQVYTTQTGRYIKIGNITVCWGDVVLSAVGGTIAGNIQIGGLPFAAGANPSGFASALSRATLITLDAGYTQIECEVVASGIVMSVLENGSNKTAQAIAVTGLAATSAFRFAAIYRTD